MEGRSKSNQVIDITNVLRFFLRHWYVFAASVMTALVITYAYHRYKTPVFSLNTKMLIKDKSANFLLPNGITSIMNSKAIDNEIALLRSVSQIRQIIDRLDFDVSYYAKGDITSKEIYKSSPFIVKFDPAVNTRYGEPLVIKFLSENEFSLGSATGEFETKQLYGIGQPVESNGFTFIVDRRLKNGNTLLTGKTYSFVMHTKDELVRSYRSKISIGLERGTSLLTVTSSGTNVEKEKDFLNTLAEVYIKGNLERKYEMNDNTIGFIDGQLSQIRESLDGVESRLENFRKDNKLMKLNDRAVPILQRVNNLEKSKADQMLDLKYYQYLKEYLLTHDDVDDIVAPSTVGVSLPMFSDLLLKLSTTYLEKEDLMANSTKDNPYIQSLETEIKNQKRVLIENISNVIHIAEMKISDFDRQIEENLGEFEKLPQLERQYIGIERLNKLNSEMYMYLLQKRAEAGIARANDVADLVLIDKAGDNGITQVSPDFRAGLIRSLLLALILPSLALFSLYLLSRKISEPGELHDISSLPIGGVIGRYPGASPLDLLKKSQSDFVQSIKKIRVKIPSKESGQGNVIGVTSTIFGDGKTFLASSLALSYAISGRKTLLADFNFHRQEVKHVFGAQIQKENRDGSPYTESGHPNLSLYAPGEEYGGLDEMNTAGNLDKWMQSIRQQFDMVICDISPVGLTSDAYELSPYIDHFLLTAREQHTPRKLLAQTIGQISETDLAGKTLLVYNDSSRALKSSSYEYYLQKEYKKGLARLVFQVKHRLA